MIQGSVRYHEFSSLTVFASALLHEPCKNFASFYNTITTRGFPIEYIIATALFFAMTDEAQHNQDITGDGHNESVEVLSIDCVSAIIKDAVGGVKDYIDDALSTTKSQVLENAKIHFKFKGNRVQHEFNINQKEKVEKALMRIKKGDMPTAISQLNSVISEFNTRNKLIKLAHKSEHGWKVVDEYQAEELADNSDDEKRIKSAIKSAAAKQKAKPAKVGRRPTPYPRRPETFPNLDSGTAGHSGNFRRYFQFNRYPAASVGRPRSTDFCFACGKAGHWRRSCPGFSAFAKPGEKQGGQQ